MPFRTRDFLLFLTAMAFLVISSTALWTGAQPGKQQASLIGSQSDQYSEEVVYEAELIDIKQPDKNTRLLVLKNKVAQLFIGNEDLEVAADPDTDLEVVEEETEVTNETLFCPDYTEVNIVWDASNLQFLVSEGARILYRQDGGDLSGVNLASTTVLQLPMNTFKAASPTCLKTDVIGIALDGSLLRNNEKNIYQIFGSETLLGYALDGFPIYGLEKEIKLDKCGGANLSGSYGYYLSQANETIVNCYSGSPIKL